MVLLRRLSEQELKNQGKIALITPAEVKDIHGADKVEGISVKKGDETFTLACDHFVPLFGLAPKLGPIADWGLEIEKNACGLVVNGTPQEVTNIAWSASVLGFHMPRLFSSIDGTFLLCVVRCIYF